MLHTLFLLTLLITLANWHQIIPGALALSISVPQNVVQGQQTTVTWTRDQRDPTSFVLKLATQQNILDGSTTITTINSEADQGALEVVFPQTGLQMIQAFSANGFSFIPLANSNPFQVQQAPAQPQTAVQNPPPPPAQTTQQPPPPQQTQAQQTQSTTAAQPSSPTGATSTSASPSKSTSQPAPPSSPVSAKHSSTLGTANTGLAAGIAQTSAAATLLTSPSSSATAASSNTGSASTSHMGTIVGAIVAALLVLALLAFAVVYIRRRRQRGRPLTFHQDMMVRDSGNGGERTGHSSWDSVAAIIAKAQTAEHPYRTPTPSSFTPTSNSPFRQTPDPYGELVDIEKEAPMPPPKDYQTVVTAASFPMPSPMVPAPAPAPSRIRPISAVDPADAYGGMAEYPTQENPFHSVALTAEGPEDDTKSRSSIGSVIAQNWPLPATIPPTPSPTRGTFVPR